MEGDNKKTYIFIDESGVNKKMDHSCFAFVFINEDDYAFIEKSILKLENKFKIKSFHWSENIWLIKKEFLSQILYQNLKLKIKVIINPINQEKELENCLFDFIPKNKNNHIFIDGKKSKKYDRKIKKHFRDKSISINRIKTVKDNNCVGIKIADYMAGFFRYYFDNDIKLNSEIKDIFKKLLKNKVIELKKPQ